LRADADAEKICLRPWNHIPDQAQVSDHHAQLLVQLQLTALRMILGLAEVEKKSDGDV